MEAYSDFAEVYDLFMEDVPYDEWTDFIITKLSEYGVKDGLVLDLGCGTGEITMRLSDKGFDMIGVDLSPDMLNIANSKKGERDILYLNQDMCSFELYGTVRAVVCICDSVNYVTEPEDLLECFRLVNNYLDPDGIFIFDFNTDYKYAEVIGDCTIAENRDEASFIWENTYYPDEHINEYEITVFKKQGELYSKFSETHYQRGYTVEEMKGLIEKAGMIFLDCIDADDDEPGQRFRIIAREKGKNGE